MTFSKLKNIRLLLPLVLCATLAGCERKGPRVYFAPKDTPPGESVTKQDSTPEPPLQHDAPWRPTLEVTVPPAWVDIGPDTANIGRYRASKAMVSVTVLASMAGQEAILVNMWRQMRGEAALKEEEAAKKLSDVPIAGGAGKMFEFADGDGGDQRRFIVAFTHRPEGSVFFKIQGDDAEVVQHRAAFLEFMKTVRFGAGAPNTSEKTGDTKTTSHPVGWEPLVPGPMQVAKYSVPAQNGAKAEVAVSIFPTDTGGVVANVKRWRAQMNMPEVDDDAARVAAQPLEGAPEGAMLIALQNEARALVGAIVPRDGRWFFYKMSGDTAAVSAARAAFVEFAKQKP